MIILPQPRQVFLGHTAADSAHSRHSNRIIPLGARIQAELSEGTFDIFNLI